MPAAAPVQALAAPLTVTPSPPRGRASRFELVLIGLAACVGLLITLHRNGALGAWLASAGQGAVYSSLEKSLGGPGFGTPRAVERLLQQAPPSSTLAPPAASGSP